jgi:ParB family chromosome partitioning protein
MDLRFVALSEIDLDDGGFEIPSFCDCPRLPDSLGRFGILDPVWLCETPARYRVADGFKRLRWALENSSQRVPCLVFKSGWDVRDIWMRRIEKKIFEGEINPAQKARIIGVLAELFGPGKIPGTLLSNLRVAGRGETIDKWVKLSCKGPQMLHALGCGELCERAAIEISDWEQTDSESVLSLLRELRCSDSIQVEIIERIKEIALREEKSRAEVLAMDTFGEVMSSAELNHREKTRVIRNFLTELRYPRLSSRRRRFEQDVEALGLPRGARLVAPESFEGGGWQMHLSFTRGEELRKIFRAALPLVESQRLEEILGKR